MTTEMTKEEEFALHNKLARETLEASLRILYENNVKSMFGIINVLGIAFVNSVSAFGALCNDKELLKFVLEGLIKTYVEKEEKND